jgi:hypothetical protein
VVRGCSLDDEWISRVVTPGPHVSDRLDENDG